MATIIVNGVEHDIRDKAIERQALRLWRSPPAARAHRIERAKENIRRADSANNLQAIHKYGALLVSQGIDRA